MNVPRRRLAPLAVLALLATGCEQPPTREIEAAQAQLDAARQEGAEAHAPDRWRDAQAAMRTARERVEARDYRGALSAANLAAERARAAIQSVRAARGLARGRIQVAQEEVRALLEEVMAIRQEAAAAKVPDEAFASLTPQLEQLQQRLEEVGAALQRGDPLKAQREAVDLKAQAEVLPAAFRQAQAKWLAEHPRGRRRRR